METLQTQLQRREDTLNTSERNHRTAMRPGKVTREMKTIMRKMEEEGLPYYKIAEKLNVHQTTVSYHLNQAFRRRRNQRIREARLEKLGEAPTKAKRKYAKRRTYSGVPLAEVQVKKASPAFTGVSEVSIVDRLISKLEAKIETLKKLRAELEGI